jgi:hypothetical protein
MKIRIRFTHQAWVGKIGRVPVNLSGRTFEQLMFHRNRGVGKFTAPQLQEAAERICQGTPKPKPSTDGIDAFDFTFIPV